MSLSNNSNYSLNISGGATFGSHVIPSTDITFDLGSSGRRWRDLYLSGSSIDLGGTLLKSSNGNLLLTSLQISTGSLKISNFINTSGNMLSGNSVGNSITTDIKVMNKRIRTSRQNANNCLSTWTSGTMTSSGFWAAITWSPELGLFIAGNNTATTVCNSSPDGINWTARTLGTSINAWDVCWSPELLLFVMTNVGSTTNPFQTSPDGITWTTRTTGSAYGVTGICWSAELGIFVACAGTSVLVSSNGTSWTNYSTSSGTGNQRVCWSAELGLFVMTDGSVGFLYSSNGTSWTSVSFTGIGSITGICWSPELYLFVAAGTTGGGIATSSNGINWSVQSSAGVTTGNSVTWSAELSIFIVVDGTNIRSSSDGIVWTLRASGLNNNYGCCWSPELSIFVVPSNNNVNNVYRSNYGLTTIKNSTPIVYGGSTDTGTGGYTKYTQAGTAFTSTSFVDLVSVTLDIGTYSISGIAQIQLTSGAAQLSAYRWVIGGQDVGQGYLIYTGHDPTVYTGYNTTNMDTIYVNITSNVTVVKIQGRWLTGSVSTTDAYQRISCVRL